MKTEFKYLERQLREVTTVEEEDRVLRENGWTWQEYYHEAQKRDEKEEPDLFR